MAISGYPQAEVEEVEWKFEKNPSRYSRKQFIAHHRLGEVAPPAPHDHTGADDGSRKKSGLRGTWRRFGGKTVAFDELEEGDSWTRGGYFHPQARETYWPLREMRRMRLLKSLGRSRWQSQI